MENAKRGFVFYFDNYFVVEDLPPDQRGWLLSALCVYAERVWRDPSVTMEEILDHYPQMSGQTRIACGFLGAAVLRDTQRWLSQRQARALRRQQGDRPGRPPAPARERMGAPMRSVIPGGEGELAAAGTGPVPGGRDGPPAGACSSGAGPVMPENAEIHLKRA